MKKIYSISLFVLVAAMITSCSMTTPYAVTNNPIGSKTGEVTNKCMFIPEGLANNVTAAGLCFNNKGYSVYEAAKKAGISKIGAVDLKVSRKIFYREYTLIVSGE